MDEYRIVLRRVGESTGPFCAPSFTLLVQAENATDAMTQAQHHAALLQGRYAIAEFQKDAPGQESVDGGPGAADSN